MPELTDQDKNALLIGYRVQLAMAITVLHRIENETNEETTIAETVAIAHDALDDLGVSA